MSVDPLPGTDPVTRAAATGAAACDQSGAFPRAALAALRGLGLTARPPLAAADAARLLHRLAAVGRGDLSVGRILEGHYNTLFLIDQYGDATQRRRFQALADDGALFGVWNTDQPGAPLGLIDGRLVGAKAFCTGVDGLAHAIVTVEGAQGREMLIVPLEAPAVDRRWWRPLGMRASGSHIVDFTGLAVQPDWRLGRAGDYVAQPWFSAGAMRFAAVQVGGAHGVLDIVLAHLTRTGRKDDPHQGHRLGEMATAVETGYLWLGRCAESWSRAQGDEAAGAEAVATVNAARGAVEAAALRVLELAERSVGAAGLIAPHPLERRLRDLRTYLRQPNPDGALAGVAQALSEGRWTPGAALAARAVEDGPAT